MPPVAIWPAKVECSQLANIIKQRSPIKLRSSPRPLLAQFWRRRERFLFLEAAGTERTQSSRAKLGMASCQPAIRSRQKAKIEDGSGGFLLRDFLAAEFAFWHSAIMGWAGGLSKVAARNRTRGVDSGQSPRYPIRRARNRLQ